MLNSINYSFTIDARENVTHKKQAKFQFWVYRVTINNNLISGWVEQIKLEVQFMNL